MVSREENSDVFSRLGAGTQDPTPGGKIRICTEKVETLQMLLKSQHNDCYNWSTINVTKP